MRMANTDIDRIMTRNGVEQKTREKLRFSAWFAHIAWRRNGDIFFRFVFRSFSISIDVDLSFRRTSEMLWKEKECTYAPKTV